MLLHRHKLVGMRRGVKNQLQHLALNQGVQRKAKLWSRAGRKLLAELPLSGWTARSREELLGLLDDLERKIGALDVAVEETGKKDAVAQLLQEHSRKEPGCVLYIAHQSIDDPRRFLFYEQYKDKGRAPGSSRLSPFPATRDRRAGQNHGAAQPGAAPHYTSKNPPNRNRL
jgi:Antibiotic biosynthesis monooxygenase